MQWVERLGRCVLGSASSPLSSLSLMGPDEVSYVTVGCNLTRADFPCSPGRDSIAALFAEAARAWPDETALVAVPAAVSETGAPNSSATVSYASLLERSEGLATALHRLRAVTEESRLVCLIFDRCVAAVVGIMGVILAGGAYVPISTTFPAARVQQIVDECAPRLLLLESVQLGGLCPPPAPAQQVLVCDDCGQLSSLSGAALDLEAIYDETAASVPRAVGEDLCYCMYTSGTTGKPKGVMVTHAALLMRTSWLQTAFAIAPGQLVPFKTSYIFGVSEWELFWTLTHGATLAIVPQLVVQDPAAMARMLQLYAAHVAFLTPSHLTAIMGSLSGEGASCAHCCSLVRPRRAAPAGTRTRTLPASRHGKGGSTALPGLHHAICCGEVLSIGTADRFHALLPSAELHNLYGPTEGSMTWFPVPQGTGEVLIGKPISNTTVLLLDPSRRPVPIGVPGEVCFGSCIARGYLRQPQLTASKFIANPLGTMVDEAKALPDGTGRVPASPRLYLSGDLAVRLPSGDMRFIGRVDRQVKVRGYRIELEAVEAELRSYVSDHPGLLSRTCAVTRLDASTGQAELIACVELAQVLAEGARPSVLDHLAARLPPYMCPSRVVSPRAFPLLPNGKTDLKALSLGGAHLDETVLERRHGSAADVGVSSATDSLGVLRAMSASAEAIARENVIANLMRAFLMYGVVVDHWAGCADGSSCRLVFEAIVWQQPEAAQYALQWIDVCVRAVGNYKCMSGFLMVSAYLDSGFARSTRFGRGDLVVLLTYLEMLWVLDPIMYAICAQTSPDSCYETAEGSFNRYVGVHRWYLLVMLTIKACLVAFSVARLPPFGQCVLVSILAFLLPPTVGCLTDAACEGEHGMWGVIRTALQPVLTFFFSGHFVDAYSMFNSAFMRYYALFMMQYFWTFHYGRATAHSVSKQLARAYAAAGRRRGRSGASSASSSQASCTRVAAMLALLEAKLAPATEEPKADAAEHGASSPPPSERTSAAARFVWFGSVASGPLGAAHAPPFDPASRPRCCSALSPPASARLRSWLLALAALSGLLWLELYQSAILGPSTYAYMQEDAYGTGMPRFPEVAAIMAMLTASVVMLALACLAVTRPRRGVSLCGQTTLGCYVFHMYLTPLIEMGTPSYAALPSVLGYTGGLVVQIAILLAVPLLFQLTIGAAFHKLLMLQYRLLFRVADFAHGKLLVRLPWRLARPQSPRWSRPSPRQSSPRPNSPPSTRI